MNTTYLKDKQQKRNAFTRCYEWGNGVKIIKHNRAVILANLLSGQWLRISSTLFEQIERSSIVDSDYIETKEIGSEMQDVIAYLSEVKFLKKLNIGNLEIPHLPQRIKKPLNVSEHLSFKYATILCDGKISDEFFENVAKLPLAKVTWVLAAPYGKSLDEQNIHRMEAVATNSEFVIDVGELTQQLIGAISDSSEIVLNIDSLLDKMELSELRKVVEEQLSVLKETNKPFKVTSAYTSISKPNFLNLVEVLQKLNVTLNLVKCNPVSGKPCQVTTSPEQELEIFKNLLKRYQSNENNGTLFFGAINFSTLKLSCGAGKNSAYINLKGNIFPCITLVEEKFRLGSIFYDSMENIQKKARSLFTTEKINPRNACETCHVNLFCGNGCLAEGYKNEQFISCNVLKNAVGHYPWVFEESASNNENRLNLLNKM